MNEFLLEFCGKRHTNYAKLTGEVLIFYAVCEVGHSIIYWSHICHNYAALSSKQVKPINNALKFLKIVP